MHTLLCILAAVPLLVANFCLSVAMWLAVLADKVQPGATCGNCWTFALVQVWRHGGYLSLRPLIGDKDGVKLARKGRLYHCAWMPRQPDYIEQTEPHERYTGKALLWRWVRFRFWIRGRDISPPKPWSDDK
jgi:hypothetical protein